MKRFLTAIFSALLLFTVVAPSMVRAADVSFTASTAEIKNPGRGTYNYGVGYVNQYGATALNETYTNAGQTLHLGLVDLSAYRTTVTLPPSLITDLNARMGLLRTAGLKAVIRVVYNYDSTGNDATTPIALGHVQQLSGFFQTNADVIAVVQAGFFGPFGEWWQGTGSLARTDTERQQLMAALRAAVHPETPIAIRYPRYIINYPGMTTALTRATAFTGSAQSQLIVHNDCFQAGPNDSGTYLSNTNSITGNAERARVANDSLYGPYGGEGCDNAGTPVRNSCAEILSEWAAYHVTYMNGAYPSATWTRLSTEGCLAQVKRSLGYRIQLDRVTHPDTASVNQDITFNVYAKNVGWGGVYDVRVPQIRLVGTNVYAAKGFSDLRLEMTPGAANDSKMPVRIRVPVAGTYAVQVCFPSNWPSQGTMSTAMIANDIRYSIRPGNADNGAQAWNTTSGCFATGSSITVNNAFASLNRYNFLQSWSSTEGGIYNGVAGSITNGARARMLSAIAGVTNPRVVGVLVSLGYNDQFQNETGDRFAGDLGAFIPRLRADLPLANAQIAFSRPGNLSTASSSIRSALAAQAAADTGLTIIDTDGLPRSTASDPYNVHFTTAGYDSIGSSAFDAMSSKISAAISGGFNPVVVFIGDSNANGQAQDDSTSPPGFTSSANIKIRTYTGTWVTYAPSTFPATGIINQGTNGSINTGPEVGWTKRFRAAYPSATAYVYKEGQGGAFLTRGTSTGTLTGTVSGSVLTVLSGTNPPDNSLITGTGIPTGTYVSGNISGNTFRLYPVNSATPANFTAP